MTFFNYSVPPLRRKQLNMDVQNLEGLGQVQFPLGKDRFYSKFYTALERACLLWSLLLIPIFGTAQFFPVSWMLQAGLWSLLSLVGTAGMISMTYSWGQNRTPDLGALWLGNANVIRIAADRLGHFFRLGKSVSESLYPVVRNERNWVFWDWICRARF
jgi:hypothetical protein